MTLFGSPVDLDRDPEHRHLSRDFQQSLTNVGGSGGVVKQTEGDKALTN